MSEVQNMPIRDWLNRQGYGCEDGSIMLTFGDTTADSWNNCTVGSYQVIGWRDAVIDGLLIEDAAAIQSVVEDIVAIHSCVDESTLGKLCPIFDDSPNENSFAWLLDWAAHIEIQHGGMGTGASSQIADLVRAAVVTNPYTA